MKPLFLIGLLMLAGCHERRPPTPTPEQSSELNDADAMLNKLDKQEGPEANASDPSNSSD